MLRHRFRFSGLLGVLFALMAQLGAGASVPRIDPVAVAGVLCHAEDGANGGPSQPPSHPADCPVCPLCVAMHAGFAALLPAGESLVPARVAIVLRNELPPAAIAPPAPHRPPSQPRAPPIFS